MSIIKAEIFEPSLPNKNYSGYEKCFLYNRYNINSDNIFLTKNEKKDYENLINSLLNQKVDVTLNGKVYLGKLSSLPRHKIKDYFKENKITKTSRLDQSDIIILNKEHLIEFNKMFDPTKSWYTLELLKVYKFDCKHDKEYIRNNSIYSNRFHTNTFNGGSFIIIIGENTKNYQTPQLVNFLQDKKSEYLYHNNLYRAKNLAEVYNYLEYILKNPHVKVIFDEDIMEPLNEDGFELDEEYLTALDNMFNSRSQDNINLALEMISNINFEKNSLAIALFLNKHNNKFIWGSGLSLNKNKSFKSILKYFKAKNINFTSDWRHFSVNLYKLHKDNPKNIEIINEFIQQNINQYLKEFGPKQYIEVKLESLDIKS